MIAVAPHHRFVQPMLASYISFGVGCYCFIRTKAMREAKEMGETNIVPTPFFIYPLSSGNWLAKSLKKLKEYNEVFTLLRKGYSVRNVAKLGGVSTSIVQRIKKEFNT